MLLVEGQTYRTRDGDHVTVKSIKNERGTYAVSCRDDHDRVTYRSQRGRFTNRPHRLDLVAVVPD